MGPEGKASSVQYINIRDPTPEKTTTKTTAKKKQKNKKKRKEKKT